jgi:hypothetical protein
VVLCSAWPAAPAFADCTNPAAPAGMIVYNQDQHVPQYCDGVNWIASGPVPGAGGTGCAGPSGAEDVLLYNAEDRVMQYCDGTNWIALGPVLDDVQDGLVGHWKLDDGAGSTSAADASGRGNTGALTNMGLQA